MNEIIAAFFFGCSFSFSVMEFSKERWQRYKYLRLVWLVVAALALAGVFLCLLIEIRKGS